jgi:hypothetical protein
VTPTADGLVYVVVPAAVTHDVAGNECAESNTLAFYYDATEPTAVLSTADADPTASSPIAMTLAFSEVCVNFTQACVNLTQVCVYLTQACVDLTQGVYGLTVDALTVTSGTATALVRAPLPYPHPRVSRFQQRWWRLERRSRATPPRRPREDELSPTLRTLQDPSLRLPSRPVEANPNPNLLTVLADDSNRGVGWGDVLQVGTDPGQDYTFSLTPDACAVTSGCTVSPRLDRSLSSCGFRAPAHPFTMAVLAGSAAVQD